MAFFAGAGMLPSIASKALPQLESSRSWGLPATVPRAGTSQGLACTSSLSLSAPVVSRVAMALSAPLLLASYTSTTRLPAASLSGTAASRRCSRSAPASRQVRGAW